MATFAGSPAADPAMSESTSPGTVPANTVQALHAIRKVFGSSALFGTPTQAQTNRSIHAEHYYVVREWYEDAVRAAAAAYTSKKNTKRDRGVIIDHFIHHRSMRDIAAGLGLSHDALRSPMNRAANLIESAYQREVRRHQEAGVPLGELVADMRDKDPSARVGELGERITAAVNLVRNKLPKKGQGERPRLDRILKGDTYDELEQGGVERDTVADLIGRVAQAYRPTSRAAARRRQ